jgi:phage tail sheath protein FI
VEPAEGLSTRNILATRLCLFEQTAHGVRLGSDVTTSLDSAWRPGMVCRLLSLVLRLAQRHGEEFVFAPSSERTWQQLVNRLDDILDVLTQRGALAAGRSEEAYSVTCNRTTMSQSDIDHGRLIVRMVLRPAVPVDAIDVQLAVEGNSLLVAGGIL